ncbi:hypothetical protein [Terribacillus sp. DMT04]|nr:hypothetical protein [Terribacillus sp. DMT04]
MTKKRIVGLLVLVTILSSVAGISFNDTAEKGHLPNAPVLTDF